MPKKIPKNYLFSYKDNNNFIYSFDIRSFEKLLNSNFKNPLIEKTYPRVVNLYKKRIDYIKKNNIVIEPFEEDILTLNKFIKIEY